MEARPTVRSASKAEEGAVLHVIMLAFAADPVSRWAIPNPEQYVAVMPTFVRAFGGNGFDHGTVDIINGGGGAALWLPPEVEPDTETLVELIQQNAPPEVIPDLMGVLEEMSGYHPPGPHWYLPVIGVDPIRHGTGFGSALMRHALARADATGLPAYLESSNPRNLSLYERFGFRQLGTIQIGSSPEVVPMLRDPA
jgi:ribosomal protein S18 acetylase RimI-like enzyme